MDDEMRLLVERLAPFMPITTNDTEHYAEVTFGEHSSQGMTMKPDDWQKLNAAYEALSTPAVDKPTSEVERAREIALSKLASWGRHGSARWLKIANSEGDDDLLVREALAALRSPTPAAGGEVREALRPFAQEADQWSIYTDETRLSKANDLTVGDLRRARTAYAASTPPHEDVRRDARTFADGIEAAAKVVAMANAGMLVTDDLAETICRLALDADGVTK